MVDQPQAPQALQTGDVTRFGKMLACHEGNPGPNCRHGPQSPPDPRLEVAVSELGNVLF
jgi:hypothetical protein